jgi:hypothetical protein
MLLRRALRQGGMYETPHRCSVGGALIGRECLWERWRPGTAPTPTVTQVLTSHYTASLSALNSSGVSGTVGFQVTGKVLLF